ncbi:MAG: transcription termination/antitermination NusG family protein [Pseudomonadota bacterium]|nr:transcription termination/antitermination NusG family protein [Pseudomonadota bacterium]
MNVMQDMIAGGRWVAATTHQFKELVAVANLEKQGLRAYCPMVRRKVRHARKLQEVLRPLFPGYVFIRIATDREQWRPILSTIGIRALVRFGDRLGFMPAGFVEGLRHREEDGAVPMPCYRNSYSVGEKLRFREGPFEGLIATVLNCEEKDRLLVLLNLLRQGVRVRVPIETVVPA